MTWKNIQIYGIISITIIFAVKYEQIQLNNC